MMISILISSSPENKPYCRLRLCDDQRTKRGDNMRKRSKSGIIRKLTLLLVCAVFAHPAAAFAVEGEAFENRILAQVSGQDIIGISEDMPSGISDDNTVEDPIGAPVRPLDEEDMYPGEAVSANEEASGNEAVSSCSVSGQTALSDNKTGYDEEISESIRQLNKILSDNTVWAVIYNCDECIMRKSPSDDADAVTKLPCAATVILKSARYAEDDLRFEVSYKMPDSESCGYIKRESFVCTDGAFCAWEEKVRRSDNISSGISSLASIKSSSVTESQALMSIDDFPESYRDRLYALLASHPNWVFVPQKHSVTSLDTAVTGEYADKNRNWVYRTAADSFKEGAADSSGNWYYASKSCIRYYMNPLNFFDEKHIFQFEQLGYNSSYHTSEGVQSILNNTFMSGTIPDDSLTYTEAFMKIGKALSLSPYHLASRVRLEQGSAGSSALISGTYSGYEGYYNYFNIKASGKTAEEVVTNGLAYAKEKGWNTRYKSLYGGAAFLGSGYISVGQDTGYLEKYDLIDPLYTHQYMQNVQAPSTEAVTTYNQYKNAGTLVNAFVFKIPVFYDAGNPEGVPADTVNTVKPSVTLKQIVKPNLFYTDDADAAYAQFKVTGNFDITGISDLDSVKETAGDRPYYAFKSYENGILTLKTVNRTAGNSKSIYKKYAATVSLDGADSVKITVNVASTYSKPVIKAETAVFCEGFDLTYAALIDGRKNAAILPSDTLLSGSYSGVSCNLAISESRIRLVKNADYKKGKIKVLLSSAFWGGDITVNISLKDAKKPAASLIKSSAVVNSNVLKDQYGTMDIKVLRTQANAMDTFVSINAANKKCEEVLGSYLYAAYDDGVLSLASLKKGAKAGSYPLILKVSYRGPDGNIYPLKNLKFTVRITDKEVDKALVLKKSGGINPVNRAGTGFKFVPVVTNTGAAAVSSAVIDPAAGDISQIFDAEFLSKGDITPYGTVVTAAAGMIVVSAREGYLLYNGRSYDIPLLVTMDNGMVINKTVTVKPIMKNAGLLVNIKKATMTRSSSVSRNYVIYSKGSSPEDCVIESVELYKEDGGEYFEFTGNSASNGNLRTYRGVLKLTDTSIKNGTYTLRFLVKYKGHADNAKAYQVRTTIRIK